MPTAEEIQEHMDNVKAAEFVNTGIMDILKREELRKIIEDSKS